jgi:hypothetical protein
MQAQVVKWDYWAHYRGGNVVRHDGSGVYVRNYWDYQFPCSADGYPNYGQGWPCWYYWGYPNAWAVLDRHIN